ncbi:ABC-2 type transport system permease protein [Streptacidiphilus sp. MAP12-33]|uniref:ABC transporter permease n=1 Tax=Streptacidiphilus sp. MAP12-33 TaxID=3156266 RepID=UPI0035142796
MSTLSYALTDSATMLRRNLRHATRYPAMTVGVVGMPVVMLLLFNYVFGGAIGHGMTAGAATATGAQHGSYLNYLVPGILLMTIASGSMPIAVAICTDMREGIVARFRTMPISRASVLTGHVVGNVLVTLVSSLLVIGVAFALGFRSTTGLLDWAGALGLTTLVTLAVTWLGAGLGLASPTPEGASNNVLPFSLLLPFLSSAFVPLGSLPTGLRQFAEYQPFTAFIETMRGLMLGTPIGHNGVLALVWIVVIGLGGYAWSKKLFHRDPVAH